MVEDTKRCTLDVDSQYVEVAAEVFSLLADPTRIRIVLALREQELSVNHLADLVGKSPTAVSQHLAKLRWGRLVATRQDGNRVFYRLIGDHARTLVAAAVFQAEQALEPLSAHQRAGLTASQDPTETTTTTTTATAPRTSTTAAAKGCPAR